MSRKRNESKLKKIQKIQSEYKPIGLSSKKEEFKPLQEYCPHCGWNVFDYGTMNHMTGKFEEHTMFNDGSGCLRCSYCNNTVLYR